MTLMTAPLARNLEWTRAWTDVNYQLGAAGPNAYDCYRLMAAVLRAEAGLDVPLHEDQVPEKPGSKQAFLKNAEEMLADESLWRPVERPEPFDAVKLRFGAYNCHCGVVVAVLARPGHLPPAGRMLHIHEGINSTIEDWHSSRWRNRVVGFRRFIGGRTGGARHA